MVRCDTNWMVAGDIILPLEALVFKKASALAWAVIRSTLAAIDCIATKATINNKVIFFILRCLNKMIIFNKKRAKLRKQM